MADKCLLFEPETVSSRKFLEAVAPRLQASLGNRAQRARHNLKDADHAYSDEESRPPFELECLEAAFLVAIGEALATPCLVMVTPINCLTISTMCNITIFSPDAVVVS